MEKKEEIIQKAVSFFADKGYFSTSMQEIAKDCGVSKGTLYNLFESKEDLLIQVFDYSHEKMLEVIKIVDFDATLSPKNKLIKKIEMQFDIVVKNKNFITMLLRTFNPENSPQITKLVNKIQITMTNWYKNSISEAFGPKTEAYIWDFTLILQGIVKEYTSIAIQGSKDIDYHETARFIVESFEIIINHTKNVKPILTAEHMAEFEAFLDDTSSRSPKEQVYRYLDDAEREIKRASPLREVRDETISVIQHLREELNAKEPRIFIVKSLLLYLNEIEACKLFVKRIQIILEVDNPAFKSAGNC